MDERARFEQWASSRGLTLDRHPVAFTKSEDRNGRYRELDTFWAWEAWRKRATNDGS